MKITVIGRPEYQVLFTRKLVAALSLLAAKHYDATIKGLTSRCDLGGRDNGLLTILDMSFALLTQDELEYTLTFREMDLLAKACEDYKLLIAPGTPEDKAIEQFRDVGRRAVQSSGYRSGEWKFDVEYKRDEDYDFL